MPINLDEPQLVRSICSALLRPDPEPLANLLRDNGVPVEEILEVRVEVAGPSSRPDIVLRARTTSGAEVVVLIEVKVCAPVDFEQLAKHRTTPQTVYLVLLVPEAGDAEGAIGAVDAVMTWNDLFLVYEDWPATPGLREDFDFQITHGTARQARAILTDAARKVGCETALSPSSKGRPTATWAGEHVVVQVEPDRANPTRFQAVVGVWNNRDGWAATLAAIAPVVEKCLKEAKIEGSRRSGSAREGDPRELTALDTRWWAGYDDSYRGRRTQFVDSDRLPDLLQLAIRLANEVEAAAEEHVKRAAT